MLNWREIPFVRLLLPFMVGIVIALVYDQAFTSVAILLALLFSLLATLTFASIPFRFRWIYGGLLQLFMIALGYQITVLHNELRSDNHFQKQITQKNIFLLQIKDIPRPGSYIATRTEVIGLRDSQFPWQKSQGHILAYLQAHPDFADLRYGDQIIVQAQAQTIPQAKNPEAFDFKVYQKFQNTHYQLFAKSDQWSIVRRDQGNPLLAIAFSLRQHFLQSLQKHLPTREEYGVAAALILGHRYALSPEVKSAYANTGATHVLAVSGLHVGFIYLGMAFILSFFRIRGKYWRLFRTAILMAGVWAFAFITGASPSVLRAATMFSFIILGRAIYRHNNIYNTLAISAFFLLCINPYYLAETGFQLSYLAVIGIVSFQGWIYRLWIIDHPVGDYFWKLISVSLAAQLTTLPICLFYFHQFPIYFWLSGLVVVPAAMGVLGLGLLLFFLESCLPFLAAPVAYLLYGVIWLMNALIHFIEQLPAATITGLWIGLTGMVAFYFILIVFTYIFWRGKKYRVSAAMVALLCWLIGMSWQNFNRSQQKELVVYHLPQKTLVDLVTGRTLASIQSSDIAEEKIKYATQNYRWKLGIQHRDFIELEESTSTANKHWWYQQGYCQFHDKRLAILDRLPEALPSEKIFLDYIILRNNADLQPKDLTTFFDCSTLIADASNAPWTIARWQQNCRELDIELIDLTEKGAQIISLQ